MPWLWCSGAHKHRVHHETGRAAGFQGGGDEEAPAAGWGEELDLLIHTLLIIGNYVVSYQEHIIK